MKEGKTGRDGMGRKEQQGWERAVLATHLPAGARAETPIRAVPAVPLERGCTLAGCGDGADDLRWCLCPAVASAGWGTLPFPRVLSWGASS